MPRTANKRSGSRSNRATTVIVPPEETRPPREGYFEYVVDTFPGPLPGGKDYKPESDRMLNGFLYGNSTVPVWLPYGTKRDEVTAYDFLTDPRTGKRKGMTVPPHGSAATNLERGVSSWADLPPFHIWGEGKWLADIVWAKEFDVDDLVTWIKKRCEDAMMDWPQKGTPETLFTFWVTSGEGTTGNNLYRIYELPKELCGNNKPHHPSMWPEKHRKYGSPVVTPPTTATVVKAPPLPAGLRYRCPGCGHWYSQGDLPGHAQVCGKGDDTDWAIMCHSDCGCENLHEAAQAKPGFPRPMKVVEEVKDESASSGSSPIAT